MTGRTDWTERAKVLLRAEMKRRGLTYRQLADRLAAIGVSDTPENIANKVSRGRFTAVFLVQCLTALECRELRLDLPPDTGRGTGREAGG